MFTDKDKSDSNPFYQRNEPLQIMSVNILIRIVRVSKNCKEAAAKLQKAPGTAAHSDTFMSRSRSSISSTVASRMKWKFKVVSVDVNIAAHKTWQREVRQR